VACLWGALAAFVLTHGIGGASSADVYSELPPDFTAQLRAQGVQYQGLSPVDAATTTRVLAQPLGGGIGSSASGALVLRTALTQTGRSSGTKYADEAALLVVVPHVRAGASTSSVYVAFLDPVTLRTLTTLTYDAAPAGSPG
jgi:hypothetical protein